MRRTFFARYSLLILCVVFFLVPFSMRGARLSLQRMTNNVKDWLPSSFKETSDLDWFGQHFAGERFVVATWPGANEEDQRYQLFLEKIQAEIPLTESEQKARLEGLSPDEAKLKEEEFRASELANRLGLMFRPEIPENWGGEDEKWFQGDDSWFYLTPAGQLYRWSGGNNLVGFLWRSAEKTFGTFQLEGERIAELGQPADHDRPNRFYEAPGKLNAQLFGSIQTGPQLLEQLAGEGGPLWPRGSDISDKRKPIVARSKALERLTGSMFGPAVPPGFGWTVAELEEHLSEKTKKTLPEQWKQQTERFLARLIQQRYEGSREKLLSASESRKRQHWLELFADLDVPPPPQQTAIIVTLSEAGKRDLARVVGRPLLGKAPGRLLVLAEQSGIETGDDGELKLGGPPVDNVAIDEEGTITLVRLIGFSVVLGVGLAYLCFRSIVVTIMIFLVGGISAVTSLSIVYWSGGTVDAILMSMPSLVYVLGLSGAVHIINYYRDATEEGGVEGAPERALSHGWFPCTLAAFTTSLGLLSLYTSNIFPIKKFGLFSAIGVMTTLALLFTYLPSALQIWPPGYHKRRRHESDGLDIQQKISGFWDRIGLIVVARWGWCLTGCILLFLGTGVGLLKINTSVQLLKLFDSDSKIIQDYEWLEANLGELVPMELVIRVHPQRMLKGPATDAEGEPEQEAGDHAYRYSLLERLEIAERIQVAVEREFGTDGQGIVGRGISAATFAPELPPPAPSTGFFNEAATTRRLINNRLKESYDELLESDYLRMNEAEGEFHGSELWRISLRLGALNNVDYGQFVYELKNVVEPILAAYHYRDKILQGIDGSNGEEGFYNSQIVILGAPNPVEEEGAEEGPDQETLVETDPQDETSVTPADPAAAHQIQQTRLFTETLRELLINVGFAGDYTPIWVDPKTEKLGDLFETPEELAEALQDVAAVVVVNDDPEYDLPFIEEHAHAFIDARDHEFVSEREKSVGGVLMMLVDPEAGTQQEASLTARDRDDYINVVYTGVVPVVYKAQRTLLISLMNSIGWAFAMIAAVMMVLLRSGRPTPGRLINFRGGMLSMIPNVFPVVLIFGAMGHMGILVDIGSMMTASVAMGVAVDDTIHFLTWFRDGIRDGLTRHQAIRRAYSRVATAMTQTTLIGGLGLSVFAISTFTPTQRFGTLMLTLLAAALLGDLVFLPALLASPLGKYFAPKVDPDSPPPAAERDSEEARPAGTDDVPSTTDRESTSESEAEKVRSSGGPPDSEDPSSDSTERADSATTPHTRKNRGISVRKDGPHDR